MALTEECARSREWTSLELDAALSRFEAAWLRRHQRACADCRAYAADVRGATVLVRGHRLVQRPTPAAVPAAASQAGGVRAAGRVGLVAALVASMAALAAGGLTTGGTLDSGAQASAGQGGGDLSSMRAIRRQQLAVSPITEDTSRVRVIEID
jgi:hypothetical protein